MAKSTADISPPLVEFLNTLPSPLTITLVGLAPSIATTRHVLQILTWRAPWQDSWLFLACWWAVCTIPELGLRYILPVVVLWVNIRIRAAPQTQQTPPITEDTLQRAIADLTAIHALIPSLPIPARPSTLPEPTVLLRSVAILYFPYLIVSHIIRIRIILALAGTLVLLWRARWAAVLRSALWRSAHFRWAIYRASSFLTGQPISPKPLSPQSQSDAQLASILSNSPQPALPIPSVRFLFTLYENQRWWMGLDWTAALLPAERPSWCSASQQPAAPPSAFALPAATTAYTLAPDGKRRLKRTARWHWEEDEWRVIVRREGAGTSRVERPVPNLKEESAAAASASRILKAAGKMRAPSLDIHERREKEKDEEVGSEHGYAGDPDHTVDLKEDEEPLTDPDGWVYGDNKWEGASSKGAMGKYTRFRRWTRIAVLTETVELIEPGELGIHREEPQPDVHNTQPAPSPPLSIPTERQPQDQTKPDSPIAVERTQSQSHPGEDGSRLRARLKAAVMGASSHS